MGWHHGFDSPFKAEIYFVSTRQLTDLKWGTANPVPLRDPDFGPVRVRAFGTYTLRAIDPAKLLSELVGTDGVYEAEEISALLRSIISMSFADVVANSGISVLDLAQNYGALSETLRREVLARIDDEFGLEIPQLYIVNVSVPAEVERALDARASMTAIGDLAAYQAYQLGNAMPTARRRIRRAESRGPESGSAWGSRWRAGCPCRQRVDRQRERRPGRRAPRVSRRRRRRVPSRRSRGTSRRTGRRSDPSRAPSSRRRSRPAGSAGRPSSGRPAWAIGWLPRRSRGSRDSSP